MNNKTKKLIIAILSAIITLIIIAVVALLVLTQHDNASNTNKECFNCGESIAIEDAFCKHCGMEVNNADEQVPVDDVSSDNTPKETLCAECAQNPVSEGNVYCNSCNRLRVDASCYVGA